MGEKRDVNEFEVPSELAAESGIKSVGLVTLTSEDELTCFKRAKDDKAKLTTELVKTSLVEVDGKPVAQFDGSVDSFWKTCPPKIRQLILTAYSEIHAAPEEATQAFLKSRKVRAG